MFRWHPVRFANLGSAPGWALRSVALTCSRQNLGRVYQLESGLWTADGWQCFAHFDNPKAARRVVMEAALNLIVQLAVDRLDPGWH